MARETRRVVKSWAVTSFRKLQLQMFHHVPYTFRRAANHEFRVNIIFGSILIINIKLYGPEDSEWGASMRP